MARFLIVAALLGVVACANVRSGDAGVSFIAPAALGSGERMTFRAAQVAGWDEMPIHSGPLDQGMIEGRPYDVRLTPGATLAIEARLVRKGAAVALASQSIPIEDDRRYFVHAEIQADDPTHGCMGCSEAVSAPIDGEAGPGARRLWLYWSFNGISAPILF